MYFFTFDRTTDRCKTFLHLPTGKIVVGKDVWDDAFLPKDEDLCVLMSIEDILSAIKKHFEKTIIVKDGFVKVGEKDTQIKYLEDDNRRRALYDPFGAINTICEHLHSVETGIMNPIRPDPTYRQYCYNEYIVNRLAVEALCYVVNSRL